MAVLPAQGHDEDEVLHLAASLSAAPSTPGGGDRQGAEERGIALTKAEAFEAVTGKGVRGEVDSRPSPWATPVCSKNSASTPG